MEEGIIYCDVVTWSLVESPGLTEPAAIRTLMEAGPMHKQVSEKQMAANGERSADRAFRSAAFASQETITKGTGCAPPKRRSAKKWPKRTERTQ
jgi:hypothetical protein